MRDLALIYGSGNTLMMLADGLAAPIAHAKGLITSVAYHNDIFYSTIDGLVQNLNGQKAFVTSNEDNAVLAICGLEQGLGVFYHDSRSFIRSKSFMPRTLCLREKPHYLPEMRKNLNYAPYFADMELHEGKLLVSSRNIVCEGTELLPTQLDDVYVAASSIGALYATMRDGWVWVGNLKEKNEERLMKKRIAFFGMHEDEAFMGVTGRNGSCDIYSFDSSLNGRMFKVASRAFVARSPYDPGNPIIIMKKEELNEPHYLN
jgi:hypothetical protein